MNKYKQENATKIRNAFARLKKSESEVVESGMYKLLNQALAYLLEAHTSLHGGEAHRHPEESNTLGWALVRDGNLVEAVSQDGGTMTPHGDALSKLQDVISSMPKGWCGVVMSDMENEWYRWDWEQDFLLYSFDNIKADGVSKYFKPIGRFGIFGRR